MTDIRFVTLDSMRVAAINRYGASPEGDVLNALTTWKQSKQVKGGRLFGFDNPSPTPGSPNYGYELWLEVPPEIQSDDTVSIQNFDGGLYGVLRVQGVENIPAAWQELVAWVETSPYHMVDRPCLEEHIHAGENVPLNEYVLDLYLPVEE